MSSDSEMAEIKELYMLYTLPDYEDLYDSDGNPKPVQMRTCCLH